MEGIIDQCPLDTAEKMASTLLTVSQIVYNLSRTCFHRHILFTHALDGLITFSFGFEYHAKINGENIQFENDITDSRLYVKLDAEAPFNLDRVALLTSYSIVLIPSFDI